MTSLLLLQETFAFLARRPGRAGTTRAGRGGSMHIMGLAEQVHVVHALPCLCGTVVAWPAVHWWLCVAHITVRAWQECSE